MLLQVAELVLVCPRAGHVLLFCWNRGRLVLPPVLAESSLEVSDSTAVGLCSSFPNAADTVIHFLSGEI